MVRSLMFVGKMPVEMPWFHLANVINSWHNEPDSVAVDVDDDNADDWVCAATLTLMR